jgi:hypothetical protein
LSHPRSSQREQGDEHDAKRYPENGIHAIRRASEMVSTSDWRAFFLCGQQDEEWPAFYASGPHVVKEI